MLVNRITIAVHDKIVLNNFAKFQRGSSPMGVIPYGGTEYRRVYEFCNFLSNRPPRPLTRLSSPWKTPPWTLC